MSVYSWISNKSFIEIYRSTLPLVVPRTLLVVTTGRPTSGTVRADDLGEKPTLPDGTRPGLAVITEGELRRHDTAPKHLTGMSTVRKRPGRHWSDVLRSALDAESRRRVLDMTPQKRGAQSCISNCLQTDNMTFVRCRFLCKWIADINLVSVYTTVYIKANGN